MRSNPMVAGTSKGCRQCRIKRKKCDLTYPCRRCTAAHLACSGPVDGPLFINRHASNFTKHSQRDVLQEALTNRYGLEKALVRTAPEIPRPEQELPWNTMTTSDTVSNQYAARSLYAGLLQHFNVTPFATVDGQAASADIFNRSTTALCLRTVIGLGSASHSRPQMLDLGVFGLLNLYVGRTSPKHHELITLSRTFYNLAVQALYRTLSKLNDRFDRESSQQQQLVRDTFCLSVVLVLFELVDESSATTNIDIHIDGTLGILQQMGPEAFQESATLKQLLSGFRGIAYASAARRRQSLFLDEPQWLKACRDEKTEGHLDGLYDIAVRLPRLLAKTNTLSSAETGKTQDSNINLLSDYTAMKSLFQNWYLQQLTRNESFLSPAAETVKEDAESKKAEYKNMLHLATMLIELDMGFADLLSSFPQHTNVQNMSHAYSHSSAVDTQTLLATMRDAVQFLRGTNEGQLVAAVPLETLNRYLERGYS